jgi:hypothetical protein
MILATRDTQSLGSVHTLEDQAQVAGQLTAFCLYTLNPQVGEGRRVLIHARDDKGPVSSRAGE